MDEDRNIQRTALPNGLTVITEEMKHIRSVSIGIWLKTGSRDEDLPWNGISHFIEHMVFKGTQHRTAEEIARQVDSIGGTMGGVSAKAGVWFRIKELNEEISHVLAALCALTIYTYFVH